MNFNKKLYNAFQYGEIVYVDFAGGNRTAVDIGKMKYCKTTPLTGIDKDGVFKLQVVMQLPHVYRPVSSLFKIGQRECFQCEYDEHCFKHREDVEFQSKCGGNIKVWTSIQEEITALGTF